VPRSILIAAVALALATGCRSKPDPIALVRVEPLAIAESQPISQFAMRDMASRGQTVFAALNDTLWISRDRGDTWTGVDFGVNGFPKQHEVAYIDDIFVEDHSVYLATDPGGLLVSRDDGRSWRSFDAETPGFPKSSDVNGVWAKGALIVAATDAGLAISRDAGATWASHDLRPEEELVKSVERVTSDGDRLYASAHPSLHISDDEAKTWTHAGAGFGSPSRLAFAGDRVFVGTWDSGLDIMARRPDGHVANEKQLFSGYAETGAGVSANLVSALHSDGQVVVLVVHGEIKVSFDRGDSWAAVEGPPFSDAPSAKGDAKGVSFLHHDPVDKRLYFVFAGRLYRAELPARAD
jgi:photosystem II stability/assembly factor-like uncharacterized protein